MRICTKCLEEQPEENFAFKNKAKGIRNTQCKVCTRLASKKHYTEFKKKYVKRSIDREKTIRRENQIDRDSRFQEIEEKQQMYSLSDFQEETLDHALVAQSEEPLFSKQAVVGSSPAGGVSPFWHHTKSKGDLAVAATIYALSRQGAVVCCPLTEHASFDLIAVLPDGKTIRRIQVKYLTSIAGALNLKTTTSWADKNGNHNNCYSLDDLDCFAIFSPEINFVGFIPVSLFKEQTHLTLRITPPANGKIEFFALQDYAILT